MRRLRTLLVLSALTATTLAVSPPPTGPSGPREHLDAHRHHAHKHAATAAGARAAISAVPVTRLSDVPCEDGRAGPFACRGIDLLSFVPAREFAGPETDPLTSDDFGPQGVAGISDLWGWTDPEPGPDGVRDEYVIVGATNGVVFFRVTDPAAPRYLGRLPNTSPVQLVWHDIKVFRNHAFVVSESTAHGMQVFDLRRLRGVTGREPRRFNPTAHYPLNFSTHNIAIDEDRGFAYLLGGNVGIVAQEPCSLHMVDISDPGRPVPAGCWAGERGQPLSFRPVQYVHDAQCTVYHGPDTEHRGRQICFAANEVNLSIVDVTDKTNPVLLGQTAYPDVAYAHQGWLTAGHAFFLLGDELDEQDLDLRTRTVVMDVRDLDDPKVHFEHLHDTVAVDHNMYVVGRLLYQSNYTAGLRVLDTTGVADFRTLTELAFFDTYPADDDDPMTEFSGTWSNYPFFASGTIAVSGIDEGLFLLRLQEDVLRQVGRIPGRDRAPGEDQTSPTPPAEQGDRALGDPATTQVFFAIDCEPVEEGDPRCASVNRTLSLQPGESTVATVGEFTPLNELIFRVEGTQPSQRYNGDATLAGSYTLRAGQPLQGQITLHGSGDAGAGLTTVHVELAAAEAPEQRPIRLGNATVTQPMLPGGPTVFEFSVEIPDALDGAVVEELLADVTVRGVNVLAGFTDGEGGSFLHLPHYR